MREWWRRYREMGEVVKKWNAHFNRLVLEDVGFGAVNQDPKLRIVARVNEWEKLDHVQREACGSELRAKWKSIAGVSDIEITGPQETGFKVLFE